MKTEHARIAEAVTTVLLTDAVEYPVHGKGPGHGQPDPAMWRQWRGKAIRICLPPELPGPMWTCDTPMVWRVAADSVEAVHGEPSEGYVCIHQIQAD